MPPSNYAYNFVSLEQHRSESFNDFIFFLRSLIKHLYACHPFLSTQILDFMFNQIIKDWNAELQERTAKFQKQATAIAEWDRRILQNRDILIRLEVDSEQAGYL